MGLPLRGAALTPLRYLLVCAGLVAGCVDTSGLSNDAPDLVAAESPDVGSSPRDLALAPADLATPPADLGTADLAMPNGPIVVIGEFHAGAINGDANGLAARIRFGWNAAVAGSANGISIQGSFH